MDRRSQPPTSLSRIDSSRQYDTHLLFHRTTILNGPRTEQDFRVFIEISDCNICHACNDIIARNAVKAVIFYSPA